MKFQKLTAGLLALSMLCAPSAGAVQMLTAVAEETSITSGTCGENLTWAFNKTSGTLTISGEGEMEQGESDTYPWSDFKDGIQTVVIEDGVTSIGESAFLLCANLTDITIPDSVTSIGYGAFKNTRWLTEKRAKNQFVIVNNILIVGSTCVGEGLIPEDMTNIPDGVTSIADGAFSSCSVLTAVTIPDSVTSIGNSVFLGCTALTTVNIPDSVTSIGYNAFADCTALTSVNIPDGVTSIEDETFENCKSLTAVTISKNVTSIGDGAFIDCTNLTDITIPNSVTSIGVLAFSNCENLTSVTIPGNVTSIGDSAFSFCKNLTEITIQNPDCEIYDNAGTIANSFNNNSKNYVYTGTIRGYEGSTAQSYAEKYGYTFESLGKFQDTPSFITSGTCGENLTWTLDESTGTLTISGTGAMTSYVFDADMPWESFRQDIHTIVIENGVTSIGEKAFILCENITDITIPDSVTSIGKHAFFCCVSLPGITIPDSVTSIGEQAFFRCSSLTEITIPDGVTCIGDRTFYQCSSLTSITIPDSVTSIGNSAFAYCNNLTDITIPDGVTSIETQTFYDCTNLTDITIPDSVTSIGEGAFRYCPGLTDITILNPDCEIYPSDTTICSDHDAEQNFYFTGTIHGYANSTAQAYAEECGYTFVSLDDAPDTPDAPLSGTCGENLTWILDESTGTLTISGTGKMDNYYYYIDIYSPWSSDISSVIIEDGVTSIGKGAFYHCDNLTSVTIPDSVTSIETWAFFDCTSLTEITIPDSVTSIEAGAFCDCTSLTDITILNPDCEIFNNFATISNGNDEDSNVFFTGTIHGYANSKAQAYAEWCGYTFASLDDAPDTPDVPTSGTLGALNWSFEESTGTLTISGKGEGEWGGLSSRPWTGLENDIQTVIIEDGVTYIGHSAFSYCENLTSVTIPNSVTTIDDSAFLRCKSLTSVTIPDSVTSIGKYAFSFCTSLTSIAIPDSVTNIGEEVFVNTPWFTAKQEENPLVILNGILIDGTTCSGDVTIPDGVTSIGNVAFQSCSGLTSITIPDGVTSIGNVAFNYCKNLTDITILNPECDIYDASSTINSGEDEDHKATFTGTIRGYDGSTAQSYAEKYGYTFVSLGEAPDAPTLAVGNINGDDQIDASDAADLLIALANIGAGQDSGLTAAQEKAADADGNGILDAGDAAVILQYAAYLGSGGTGTLAHYMLSAVWQW